MLLDRKDPTRMWVSSWISGLIEYKNNQVVQLFNGRNTGGAMDSILPGWWRCSGLDMDSDGNLFFALSDVPRYLSVKKTKWYISKFFI